MSPERNNLDKPNSVYLGGGVIKREKPTLVQIQRYIAEQKELTEISQQSGIENLDALKKHLFSRSGNLQQQKLAVFERSLFALREKYGDDIIQYIDEKSILPTGEINEGRVRKNKKKKNFIVIPAITPILSPS